MSSTHVIHGPAGSRGFGATPTTTIGWVAGALAILYAIGAAQFFTPFRIIGLGVPTVVGLLAGACGLFAVTKGRDRSWVAWLGVAAAVVAVALSFALA